MDQNEFFEGVLDILKDNGYKNTTFDKIAKKTGIGRSTLFAKYKNKETLIYSAIYHQTISVENISLLEELSYENLRQDIHLLFSEYFRLYMKQMPVYRLFMLPSFHDKELNKQVYRKLQTIFDHFINYLQLMRKKNKVSFFSYDILTDMLFSTILKETLALTGKQIPYEDRRVQSIIEQLADDYYYLLKK